MALRFFKMNLKKEGFLALLLVPIASIADTHVRCGEKISVVDLWWTRASDVNALC